MARSSSVIRGPGSPWIRSGPRPFPDSGQQDHRRVRPGFLPHAGRQPSHSGGLVWGGTAKEGMAPLGRTHRAMSWRCSCRALRLTIPGTPALGAAFGAAIPAGAAAHDPRPRSRVRFRDDRAGRAGRGGAGWGANSLGGPVLGRHEGGACSRRRGSRCADQEPFRVLDAGTATITFAS